jgi:hypothetical protein
VLQHIQASIFHYNTIGLRVVSIEIWPSADSMYFEHYLRVLAAAPIIWKTAINRPSATTILQHPLAGGAHFQVATQVRKTMTANINETWSPKILRASICAIGLWSRILKHRHRPCTFVVQGRKQVEMINDKEALGVVRSGNLIVVRFPDTNEILPDMLDFHL